MDRVKEIIVLTWEGVVIEVSYEPNWLNMSGAYQTAHLELRVVSPKGAIIPVTETGYRSHFLPKVDVDEDGSPEAYVLSWLDLAAKASDWLADQDAHKQLSLF